MRPTQITVTGTGRGSVIVPNYLTADFQMGVYLLCTGSSQATVQITGDDTYASGFTASTANWFNTSITTTGDGSKSGEVTQPCRGVTVNVTSYDSDVTLIIVQAGLV